MASGSLIDGAGQIQSAADRLSEIWTITVSQWDDSVRRSIEEEHMEPLFQQVRLTLDAIARLNGILTTACRECEDRS